MKNIVIWAMLCFFIGVHCLDYTPNQVIIKTHKKLNLNAKSTGSKNLDAFFSFNTISYLKAVTTKPNNNYYVVTLQNKVNWEKINSKRSSFDNILHIQPNYLYKFNATPNDPLFSNQQVDMVKLKQAWDLSTGSKNVLVAVIDSGIAFNHPDLQTNIYYNKQEIPDNGIDDDNNGYVDDYRGWDFSDAPELSDIAIGDYLKQDNDPSDENWHGTHVSGIIAADADNSIGLCGICWDVNLLPIRAGFKTTAGQGYLQDDDVSAAIVYAADMGAEVINISWGDENYSQIIADACQYAYNKGCVIVCAAGNTGLSGVNYPAKLATTICVGAVDPVYNLTGFSSYGPNLDVMAPGMNIISTYNPADSNPYAYMPGTSMAAPFVSGAVALFLSKNPTASNQQVKAALCASAKDIGDTGFDNIFGNGVLDIYAFLNNNFKGEVKITKPTDFSAVSIKNDGNNRKYFDIVGTVNIPDLFRFSVMFSNKSHPSSTDWKDVSTFSNSPNFYYENIVNGKLARFYIPPYFEEGNYLIRVKALDNDYNDYISDINISYDITAPVLKEEFLKVHKRYSAENINYYMQAVFDEPVYLELNFTDVNQNTKTVYSSFIDSIQILKVPKNLSEGAVNVKIKAINKSGFIYQGDTINNVFYNSLNSIETNGFTKHHTGKTKVFVNKGFDFNQNGKLEFVAMDFENSAEGNVACYEFEGNTLLKTHKFDNKFWPRDIGNTNTGGQDLLATKIGTALLYDTVPANLNYPNLPLIELEGTFDGVFANIDLDDEDELITVKSATSERVIDVFDRTNLNTFTRRYRFYNATPTVLRNTFVPKLVIKDLTANGRKNMLTADTDGDVMVFEFRNNQDPILIWHHQLPVLNAYMLSSGDYNGDGKQDFTVGGYVNNNQAQAKTFWYFGVFTFDVAEDTFKQIDEFMFDDYSSNNSVISLDIDGDNDDELVCALSPNLYILNYVPFVGLTPIYTTKASNNFNICGISKTNASNFKLAYNAVLGDTTACYVLTKNEEFTGPKTVKNFMVNPLNTNSINISWKPLAKTPNYYKIYKKVNDVLVKTIRVNSNFKSYIDTEVTEDIKYEYAITAYDDVNYTGIVESMPTLYKSAIPKKIPQVIGSPLMVGDYWLKINFDAAVLSSSSNIGHYNINNTMGYPVSVNLINQQKTALLRFNKPFVDADDYTINITGLLGKTGVEIPNLTLNFMYNADTSLPKILKSTIIKPNKVKISFSKFMNNQKLQNIENYTFKKPYFDFNNAIVSVIPADTTCVVTFLHNLRYSNQKYQVFTKNLTDVNNNKLSNDADVASFGLTLINNLNFVEVVPNPLNLNTYSEFRFLNLPLNQTGKFSVYDLSGQLVFKEDIPKLSSVNNIYSWKAENNVNRKLSSGTYYYVIKMGNKFKKGTLSIVH